jgi:hypothetical protein
MSMSKQEEKAMKQIQSYMKNPKTQVKASLVLAALQNQKDNDAEAMAIAIMLLETVKNLPKGAKK